MHSVVLARTMARFCALTRDHHSAQHCSVMSSAELMLHMLHMVIPHRVSFASIHKYRYMKSAEKFVL